MFFRRLAADDSTLKELRRSLKEMLDVGKKVEAEGQKRNDSL